MLSSSVPVFRRCSHSVLKLFLRTASWLVRFLTCHLLCITEQNLHSLISSHTEQHWTVQWMVLDYFKSRVLHRLSDFNAHIWQAFPWIVYISLNICVVLLWLFMFELFALLGVQLCAPCLWYWCEIIRWQKHWVSLNCISPWLCQVTWPAGRTCTEVTLLPISTPPPPTPTYCLFHTSIPYPPPPLHLLSLPQLHCLPSPLLSLPPPPPPLSPLHYFLFPLLHHRSPLSTTFSSPSSTTPPSLLSPQTASRVKW